MEQQLRMSRLDMDMETDTEPPHMSSPAMTTGMEPLLMSRPDTQTDTHKDHT
jgi:hypothetical protein